MSDQVGTINRTKKFYDIPTAAESAGFNSRQFRKIIKEDRIPVQQIGSKLFINARDCEVWKSTRGDRRLEAALQQLDRWIRDAERASVFETVSSDATDF